ncbi:MAG: hypothetical protein ACK5MF_06280 [Vibrio sp.]|uniref:hypothetical protein n=1 Tax=Vibrio sp. TaxID=678 RepID=UPI003A890B48
MKKALILTTLLLSTHAVAANTVDSEVLSLRYSDANNHATYGIGFTNIRGAGEYGFTLSADVQNFDVNGEYIENVGQEKEIYEYQSIMGGLSYGVTDQFYVMPKVGFTYTKREDNFKDSLTNEKGEVVDYMGMSSKDEYGFAYGIDFMFLYKSLAYGIGITDYNYLDTRETKANISVGYKFN